MNVTLSELIGNLLQRVEGLQQQLPQGSVPEGVFAELLANANLSEETVAQLEQAIDQSHENQETLLADLAARVLGRLTALQEQVDETGDGLIAELSTASELSVGAATEDTEEPVHVSGPPDHRAIPDVDLPEAAIAHALHSNGAPFVPYQAEEPVDAVVDEVVESSSGDPPVVAPPVSSEDDAVESVETVVDDAVVPDAEAAAAVASLAASVVASESDPETPRPSASALSAPGADFRSARAASVLAALQSGNQPGRPGDAPVLGTASTQVTPAVDDGAPVEPAPPPNSNAPPATNAAASDAAQSMGIAASDVDLTSVAKPDTVTASTQTARVPTESVPAPAPGVSAVAVAPMTADGGAEVARTNMAPAFEAPVVTIRNVGDVAIQSIRHLIGSGEQTITIKLVPESLGQLQITVTSGDDSVEVALAAASQSVRHVLENQLHALRDALSREGIDVSRATVTVTTSGDSDASLARHQAGQSNGFGRDADRHHRGLGYEVAPGSTTHTEWVHSTRPEDGRLNVLV